MCARLFLACCSLSLVALPAFSAADEIYRWTDPAGVTHFSDSAPAGVKAQTIRIAPSTSAPAPATDWRKLDEEFQERHNARQQALDAEIRGRRLEAELEAIKEGRGTPVPGDTLADTGFQKRVLWALVSVDQVQAPECSDHSVAGTEAIGRDVDKQEISERWILDRCGEKVPYRLSFMPFYLAGGPVASSTAAGGTGHRVRAILDERASFTFEPENALDAPAAASPAATGSR